MVAILVKILQHAPVANIIISYLYQYVKVISIMNIFIENQFAVIISSDVINVKINLYAQTVITAII